MEMEIINVLVPIVVGIIIVGIMITIVCAIGIHNCNKTINKCDDEIERINRKLRANDLDRAGLKEEINNLKTVMDFINKWREHGLEVLLADNIDDSYYSHPVWKEFNALDEDVQDAISDYVNSHTEYFRKLMESEV